MRRSLVRRFYLSGLAVVIIGVVLVLISVASGTTTSVGPYGGTTTTPNNLPLFVIGIVLVCLGAIPVAIAWIGALIRTAQLGEWVWFVLLLLFQGITLLVYVITGPDQPRANATLGAGAPRPPAMGS